MAHNILFPNITCNAFTGITFASYEILLMDKVESMLANHAEANYEYGKFPHYVVMPSVTTI